MAKAPIRITAPFDESVARSLKAGDSVLISGTIIAARDAARASVSSRNSAVPVSSTTLPGRNFRVDGFGVASVWMNIFLSVRPAALVGPYI